MTVTICGHCGGEWWKYYGAKYDAVAKRMTEFAECLTCGEVYLYTRPPRRGEAPA